MMGACLVLHLVQSILAYSGGGGEGGAGQTCDTINLCNVQWPGETGATCPPGMTKVILPSNRTLCAHPG